MATSSQALALNFHETRLDLVEHDPDQSWVRGSQVASALGYTDPRRGIAELYERNAAEFTDTMTALVKLPTAGGVQEVRIFSLRGAHLLGMFARTERAAEFRRWVLDVLEHSPQPPAYPAVPALVGQTFERVVAERDALRAMLAERVLKEEPRLRKVIYYYNLPGLTHRERALLMGWKKSGTYIIELKRLALLGLVDYQPAEWRVANAQANLPAMRDGNAKLRTATPASPPKAASPQRPSNNTKGHSPEKMAELRARQSAKLAQTKAKLAAEGGAQ